MYYTSILWLLVLDFTEIEYIQKLVHAVIKGKERVGQLFYFEAIWEGQARPVLNLK